MPIGERTWSREYSCAGLAISTYQLRLQLVLLISFLSTFFKFSSSSSNNYYLSPCGDRLNISCPFYFEGDFYRNCDHDERLSQELQCHNNRTVIYLSDDSDQSYRYYVADINYGTDENQAEYSVRLINTRENQKSNPHLKIFSHLYFNFNKPVSFLDCAAPIAPIASKPRYIATKTTDAFSACSSKSADNYTASSSLDKNYCQGLYSYAVLDLLQLLDVAEGCKVSDVARVSPRWVGWELNIAHNQDNIYSEVLAYGFDVLWEAILCSRPCKPGLECGFDNELHAYKCQQHHNDHATGKRLLAALLSCSFVVAVLGLLFLPNIIQWIEQRKEDALKVRMFMENYKALKPTRYSYSDIKKITNKFKHKLGQGGYGSVFKGQISSDILVAVKVLHSDSKASGDDFINEVSTIGKIHHVNVVRLLGYCADGCNRALVYEFQPNHSLEKFVYKRENQQSFIGWKKMQKIAVGVAKGIKYLHQGCAQQILHFDIKPNNILLDQNFNPKISDFGLAKLCNKGRSIVSMTGMRGTVGYIAPEVFSRNFGNVSAKSDVYSFGMLLLEMVGGKNNDAEGEENSSDVYFPEWIFGRLEKGGELVIQIENEDDGKIARKLTIVGLWCIGWHPIDRPSMKRVIQMLEADECPDVPPNPFSSTTSGSATHAKSIFSESRLQVISEAE